MKIEVHKQGGSRKVISIDEGATKGATVGVNVWNQDGTLFVPFTGDAEPDLAITYWSLILEIPLRVVALAQSTGLGLYAITAEGTGETREIEGVAGRTLVTDGDGVAGNPIVDLDELPNTGIGASPVKIYTRDDFGRIEGDQDANTDDLPEGTTNLYFTDERAQDAVGSILEGGGANDVALSYVDSPALIRASIVPIFSGGTFGDGTHVARISVNTKGQVVTATEIPITGSGTIIGSVNSGVGINVDNVDPSNPIVNLDAASIASLALADSATQTGDSVSTLVNDAGYVTDAPIDGTPYARQDAGWVPVPGGEGGGSSLSTMGACFTVSVIGGATSVAVRSNCAGTITSATALGAPGESGSVVFDVKKVAYVGYSGGAVSICGGNFPQIISASKSENTLVGWDVDFVAGDIFIFDLGANSGFTGITLTLGVTKS